jgi:hypothetical protein
MRQTRSMSWETVDVGQVQVGDEVRWRNGQEFVVARIDHPFLGREEMVCFIEHNDERWNAYPMPLASTIERNAG